MSRASAGLICARLRLRVVSPENATPRRRISKSGLFNPSGTDTRFTTSRASTQVLSPPSLLTWKWKSFMPIPSSTESNAASIRLLSEPSSWNANSPGTS
ncbi:hypothetical protein [Sorangium sp. So ce385]|uniref:hypothetical protein n=1 Tax=Sorangium sp. So ce385 TaxID=3133308 RepID=UPI003F5CB205